MNLLVGAVTIGLILSLLALGVFLTDRVFGLLDLTTDGAFGVGAATAAALLSHGWPPAAATAIGAWAGAMAGLVTGMVHTRFGVNALLAGILTTTALYSGNLYIMGGGDRSIANVPTLITRAEQALDWSGIRKRRLRVDDLLATFDDMRGAELLDASAAAMLERIYV